MSKKSKRKKVLAAIVGLAGASKLGLIGKMPTSVMGDKFAKARKAMTSNAAMRSSKKPSFLGPVQDRVVSGITKLKRSSLPSKRNMKSIFAQDDGSIIKGLEKFKDKDIYSKTMKSRRGETTGKSLKNFLNKVVLGPKTQLSGGGEAKVKTKLNGTLKTKTY